MVEMRDRIRNDEWLAWRALFNVEAAEAELENEKRKLERR